MQKLVEDLVLRIKRTKENEAEKIKKMKELKDDKMILFYSGKVMAFDYCIEELFRMISYYEGEKKQ